MGSTLKLADVVDRAVGRRFIRAEVAVRVRRVKEPLDALLDLRAAKLRDERVVESRLDVSEIEVMNLLPMPGLERGLREQESENPPGRRPARDPQIGFIERA